MQTGLIGQLAAGIKDGNIKTWQPKDKFSFHCTLCGRCCTNNEIVVDTYDILNLRRALGLTTREMFDRQLLELGWSMPNGNVMCRIKFHQVAEDIAACPFLKSLPEARGPQTVDRPVGCAVHAARPAVCRGYPFGRVFYYGPDGNLSKEHIVMVPDVCEEGLTAGKAFGVEQRVEDWIAESQLQPYWDAATRTPLPIKRLVEAKIVKEPQRRPPPIRWMSEKSVWRCYMPIYLVDEMPWVAREFPENRRPGPQRHEEDLKIIDRIRELIDELSISLRDVAIDGDDELRRYLEDVTR